MVVEILKVVKFIFRKELETRIPLGYWTDKDNLFYGKIFEKEFNYECNWEKTWDEPHYAILRESSENENLKLSYTNPITASNQGIGSGAGYIELSNGTYEIDSSLN